MEAPRAAFARRRPSPTAPPREARPVTRHRTPIKLFFILTAFLRIQACRTGRSENRGGNTGQGLALSQREANIIMIVSDLTANVGFLSCQKTTGCCSWRPRPWTPPTWSWPSRLSSKRCLPRCPSRGRAARGPASSPWAAPRRGRSLALGRRRPAASASDLSSCQPCPPTPAGPCPAAPHVACAPNGALGLQAPPTCRPPPPTDQGPE